MVDENSTPAPEEKSDNPVETPNSTSELSSDSSPQQDTLSVLERAEKLNKETREAEARMLEHRKAIEEIETRRVMGGQTSAGSVTKTSDELKQEKVKEIADDIVGAFNKK